MLIVYVKEHFKGIGIWVCSVAKSYIGNKKITKIKINKHNKMWSVIKHFRWPIEHCLTFLC